MDGCRCHGVLYFACFFFLCIIAGKLYVINQSINLYHAIVQRRVLQCGYAESKRNVLRRILNVSTDGAVRQFSGREFQMSCSLTAKGLVVCGCILKACIAEFA